MPIPLLTVTEYVPVAVIVGDGTVAVAEVALVIATGPVHKKSVTLAAPFALSVSVWVAHFGPPLVALVRDGASATVTVEVVKPVKPLPSVTVTVYIYTPTASEVSVVTDVPVVGEIPVPGVHA